MNTADQIKQFLAQGRPATVEQISRALDLTKADIHYHVRQLLANNEISLSPRRYQSGPGRPARLYQLENTAPIGLSRLLISCLTVTQLGNDPDEREQNKFCETIARWILSACPSTCEDRQSPTVRLNHCVSELALLGFKLHWQAGKSGPVIMVDQEPLTSILDDTELVKKILESLVHQMRKMIA